MRPGTQTNSSPFSSGLFAARSQLGSTMQLSDTNPQSLFLPKQGSQTAHMTFGYQTQKSQFMISRPLTEHSKYSASSLHKTATSFVDLA